MCLNAAAVVSRSSYLASPPIQNIKIEGRKDNGNTYEDMPVVTNEMMKS